MKRLLSLAVALTCSWTAMAQQQPEKREAKPPAAEARSAAAGGTVASDDGLFDRLDANRDGYLSAAELERESAAQANWIAADRNNDGRISRDEFRGVEVQQRR
jgi:hypothetical protein